MKNKAKRQEKIIFTAKILLFVVVVYFFVQQLLKLEISQFRSISLEHPFLLLLVIFLFFINWGFELLKWREILKVNQIDYSIAQLLHSFFSGVTTGVVTPNRLGNFIGRLLFFKGKTRTYLILGTLYSNFSQFLITLIFGAFSLVFTYKILFENYGNSLLFILFGFLIFSLIFYFGIPFFSLHRLRFFKRKANVFHQFQLQANKLAAPFLLWSVGRYFAFSLQYFFFLIAFGVKPTFLLLNGIFLFYLISTLIPSVFLGKIVVREATGLIVLSFFVENNAVIVVSSLLLWLINLGLPSLVGLFFILKKKHVANA